MSNNDTFELLKKFGLSGYSKFAAYADARIQELYRSFEQACDMDEVSRIKGAIEEIRRLKTAFKAISEG